jgi:hypothetical protein
MRARLAIGCALVLAGLSLAAAPAGAAPRPSPATRLSTGVARLSEDLALTGQVSSALGIPHAATLLELRFENRDGYAISVVAYGQTVALSVSRARARASGDGDARRKVRERVSETTYLAHGMVKGHSIRASFGDRGRIAMRFRPTGPTIHATRGAGCRKPSGGAIAEIGVFDGLLRFEGEGGYTSVAVHHARGRSVDFAALLSCLLGVSPAARATPPRPEAPLGIDLPGIVAAGRDGATSVPSAPTHPSAGPRSTTLVADRKESLSRTLFAAQVRGAGQPRFLAVSQASEGQIGIVRLAYARGAPGAFSFDDALSSGSVSPPPPFSGSGELRRGLRDAKSWSGSLEVSFLGAPHARLIGEPFGAWLSQGF